MTKHSKNLEDTGLWKAYQKAVSSDLERMGWVKKVYEAAAACLKDVRQAFINYTLHDEKHVLNVLDAMEGLLGEQIGNLTIGEMELLILAACMHDLGMVYTDEEREACLENEAMCRKFIREHQPELTGCSPKDWPEDIQQWYLRTLHPFRLSEVLQNKEWGDLFENCPLEVVPRRCILAVCQAHGEEPRSLRDNRDLEYLRASDTSPLFCALLLRLVDLLDFDDTRAPRVLYSYVSHNEKSREEWDKHQASAGFRYPPSPSGEELPYKARCKNPVIEHAVRNFLDWVDEELGNCMMLQRYCPKPWQQKFPFPRAVSRSEIESDGYTSGDFCMTMDQERILKLLMGENLYDNRDVFVRELLQNAIDATLLRSEMDSDFKAEEARIDFWEWNDKEGNFWFRIDDQGTGMTLGMIQRYFLKVGNSYYTSQELKRDLRDHGQMENYQGISRFGIGFLSCFLCGDYVEVSTLYFDPEKNRREEDGGSQQVNYGLRLQVTGLKGYYTLKNQAQGHPADSLPMPGFCEGKGPQGLEQRGYRKKAGTSFVIRLNPGKLGVLNLRGTVEKYLCGARMPVYYNGRRVGKTYREVMQAAHAMAGERIYELSPELKQKFDECFPCVRGQYPRVAVEVIPLDTEENQPIADLSGVLVKYEVRYEQTPEWEVKGQEYEICAEIDCSETAVTIKLQSRNRSIEFFAYKRKYRAGVIFWPKLLDEYGYEAVTLLEEEFEKLSSRPQTGEDLGEVWRPFAEDMDIYAAWKAYHDYQQEKEYSFNLADCGCPSLDLVSGDAQNGKWILAYQGVTDCLTAGHAYHRQDDRSRAVFFLEGECRPVVEVSRSQIVCLPLKTIIAISGLAHKNRILNNLGKIIVNSSDWEYAALQEWRQAREFSLDQWMNRYLGKYFEGLKQEYLESWNEDKSHLLNSLRTYGYNVNAVLDKYVTAYFQDNYHMTICYEEGQIITFHEKTAKEREDIYDLFPPLLFCKAASDQSRRFIGHANAVFRRGLTSDHPFIEWLLENSNRLNQYFQRQFGQMIRCLCKKDAEDIIQECGAVREQLLSLTDRHGVDIDNMPRLTEEDFWRDE